MCKEIIGYKLKKDCKRYERIAMDITKCQGNIEDLEFYLLKNRWGEMLNRLKEAGVLELWFEPIYEEEKFKVGDWIMFLSAFDGKNYGYVTKIEDLRDESPIILGKNVAGIWCIYDNNNGGFRIGGNGYTYGKDFKLATKQEIEQHLIAEAKKRGFGKGIKWINPIYKKYEFASKGNFTSEFSRDNIIYLYLDHNTIYNKGEWAKIIKDEEIEISGYKAKFDEARKTVQFGCKTITLEELKAVLVVMELNKKFDYKFSISNNVIYTIGECGKYGEIRNGVTKETIQKLIKTLEDE